MGSQLLASKIVIQEEAPQLRQIEGVPTSVLGVLGITEKGPFVPTLVSSVDQYAAIYGGYVANGDVRQAIDGFFLGGGSQALVMRTTHYTDPTSPVTKTSAAATATLSTSGGTPAPTLVVNGKWDGAYCNAVTPVVAASTDGVAAHFNFSIVKAGLTIESFGNLTMDPTDPRYALTIVNDANIGSKYVTLVDDNLDVTGAAGAAAARPANGTFTMSGGNDGLTGLTDTDFVGASSNTGKTGMRGFDTVHPNLLIVPGRATPAVQNALLTYCETTRGGQMFAILGPPANLSGQDAVTYFQGTAALVGASEYGAAYWPRLQVLNPNTAVFGNAANIVVDCVGYVAAVYARRDAARLGGVYDPPAGSEDALLTGVLGFETNDCLQESVRDVVYPARVNPLTAPRGGQPYIDGSKCLKGTGNFPWVSQRRGAIYIEQSIKDGLEFARHQNNTEGLRATCKRTVNGFLNTQMGYGAFITNDPATAYFVDFGDALNPVTVQVQGQLIGRVGLAFNDPAEFIILRFSADTQAFQQANAPATA